MTYCHVVIGEVVPKNLAIDKADRLAVIVAPALMVFYRGDLGFRGRHRGLGHGHYRACWAWRRIIAAAAIRPRN